MAFPDRIERTLELTRPPEVVWTALTTAEGLGSWFGEQVTIDLQPGGTVAMSWSDGGRETMRVERVEEPTLFAFTWPVEGRPDDDPRRTYVEFILEPAGTGTRLRVVETGFAQLDADRHRELYDSHVEGWGRELGELADHLAAA